MNYLSITECPVGGGGLGRQKYRQQSNLSEPSIPEVEVAIGKLKTSPGVVQIPAELIQSRGAGKHCILKTTNLLS
jgi:hypothetical protein